MSERHTLVLMSILFFIGLALAVEGLVFMLVSTSLFHSFGSTSRLGFFATIATLIGIVLMIEAFFRINGLEKTSKILKEKERHES